MITKIKEEIPIYKDVNLSCNWLKFPPKGDSKFPSCLNITIRKVFSLSGSFVITCEKCNVVKVCDEILKYEKIHISEYNKICDKILGDNSSEWRFKILEDFFLSMENCFGVEKDVYIRKNVVE